MEDEVVEHAPSTMFTIAAVQGQLTALQAKYSACLKDNVTLRKLLEEGKEDQADIYYYLQKKLDDNYNNISELELQIVEEQSDRERAEAAFEAKIKDLEGQLSHQKEKYEEKVMWLEDKLAVLKKFDERREEIEAEHQRVLRDVDVEKQRAKELVDEMERKCIRDKENIKREMLIKIQETKSNLMAMASEKLDEITKRTILENDQLKMELRFQNRETERVVSKIKKIEAENQELRNLLNLSKHTEVEMTRKLGTYSRIFKRHQLEHESLDSSAHGGSSVVSSPAELVIPSSHPFHPDNASVALSSLAEVPESPSLPAIRAPGVLSDNRSEAGASEAGVRRKDEDDEFSVVSFGSKFLPTRGGIITRTIGCQTVPSKVDDALETLGRSFFRVKQTYPSNWAGPQPPNAKRPAVGAGRKTASQTNDDRSNAASPDRSVDGHKPEPPSPSKHSVVSAVSSVGMDDLSSVGSRSTTTKPRIKNTKLSRGYSLTKNSLPHGRKIRLRRPDPASALSVHAESGHSGGQSGSKSPISLVVAMPALLR